MDKRKILVLAHLTLQTPVKIHLDFMMLHRRTIVPLTFLFLVFGLLFGYAYAYSQDNIGKHGGRLSNELLSKDASKTPAMRSIKQLGL